jgi:hypothetical protein
MRMHFLLLKLEWLLARRKPPLHLSDVMDDEGHFTTEKALLSQNQGQLDDELLNSDGFYHDAEIFEVVEEMNELERILDSVQMKTQAAWRPDVIDWDQRMHRHEGCIRAYYSRVWSTSWQQ